MTPAAASATTSPPAGYHLPPREFYRLHPEKKPGPDWRWQKVDWAAIRSCHPERSEGSPFARSKTLPVATCFIPPDIVLRSVRQDRHSDFVTFLLSILDPVVVEDLVRDYQLGVTSRRDVIFFQLDVNGSCRTGKIMKYDPETGHRIKDENCPGRINWVHSLMKASGQLPREWELTQCLFGEHLLRQYPGKVVALVVSTSSEQYKLLRLSGQLKALRPYLLRG